MVSERECYQGEMKRRRNRRCALAFLGMFDAERAPERHGFHRKSRGPSTSSRHARTRRCRVPQREGETFILNTARWAQIGASPFLATWEDPSARARIGMGDSAAPLHVGYVNHFHQSLVQRWSNAARGCPDLWHHGCPDHKHNHAPNSRKHLVPRAWPSRFQEDDTCLSARGSVPAGDTFEPRVYPTHTSCLPDGGYHAQARYRAGVRLLTLYRLSSVVAMLPTLLPPTRSAISSHV